MIFAELHDKLGADYSRAHERAEDLLTSTVFGLLRYLPAADGLLAVLRRARPARQAGRTLTVSRDAAWLPLDGVAAVTVSFWPFWPGHGEPDMVLTLANTGGVPTAVVVVEAKLHAPKSGRADPDGEELAADDPPSPDQLVRYWQGLTRRQEILNGAVPAVVYLTRHATPPIDELAESLRLAPGMRLAWLSWRDVWAVAAVRAAGSLPAGDLARLLAHKGLKYFDGFHAGPWGAPARTRFWRPARRFSRMRPWPGYSGRRGFWSRGEANGG